MTILLSLKLIFLNTIYYNYFKNQYFNILNLNQYFFYKLFVTMLKNHVVLNSVVH